MATRIIVIQEDNTIEEVIEGKLQRKDLSGIGEWAAAAADLTKAKADWFLKHWDETPLGTPDDFWTLTENPLFGPNVPRTATFWEGIGEAEMFKILFNPKNNPYFGQTIVYDMRV